MPALISSSQIENLVEWRERLALLMEEYDSNPPSVNYEVVQYGRSVLARLRDHLAACIADVRTRKEPIPVRPTAETPVYCMFMHSDPYTTPPAYYSTAKIAADSLGITFRQVLSAASSGVPINGYTFSFDGIFNGDTPPNEEVTNWMAKRPGTDYLCVWRTQREQHDNIRAVLRNMQNVGLTFTLNGAAFSYDQAFRQYVHHDSYTKDQAKVEQDKLREWVNSAPAGVTIPWEVRQLLNVSF